jgi:hypothetical protein
MFDDAVDNVTPVEESRAIAQGWRNAKLVKTQGLGHKGVLQSRESHD